MPPKEKISKVRVTDTAFAMTREYGFKEVTARKLAEKLGCSTQPIFRVYENMDELREELFYQSAAFFGEYILSKKSKTRPLYITMALAYIDLAQSEKNLFELIASVDDFGTETIRQILQKDEWAAKIASLPGTEGLSEADLRDFFMMYWMFVHGLASLLVGKRVVLTDKEIKTLLEKAYMGFLSQF